MSSLYETLAYLVRGMDLSECETLVPSIQIIHAIHSNGKEDNKLYDQ